MTSTIKQGLFAAVISAIVSLGLIAAIGPSSTSGHGRYGAIIDNTGGIKFNSSGVDFNSHKGLNVSTPTNGGDAVNKTYADGKYANTTTLDAITAPAGDLSLNSHKITSLLTPSPGTTDAVNAQFISDPRDAFEVKLGTDFLSAITTALSASVASDGIAISSAGNCTNTVLSVNDANRVGVWQISCQTTTTSSEFLVPSATGTQAGTITFATAARVVYDFEVAIPTISDGTQTFGVYVGSNAPSDATLPLTTAENGCQFQQDSNTDTHWQFKCCSSTSAHCTTVTGAAVVANGTYYHLKAIKPAGADVWSTITVDGVSMGTISADVPTTVLQFPLAGIKRSAGTTARTANFDWVRWHNISTRAL